MINSRNLRLVPAPPSRRQRFLSIKGGWLALGAAWSLLVVVFTVKVAGDAADDFFITYRYAWNLVHGHGFVFNPGEPVFGLTNPAFALLLASLHSLTRLPIEILGTVVFGLSLVGLAIVLLREAHSRGAAAELALGGTLVLGSSFLWVNHGSAGPTALLLIALGAALGTQRPILAGLLVGAASGFRPEALLGIGIVFSLLWHEGRRIPWRFAVAATSIVALGMAEAWFWFGTPIPQTLLAKHTMAEANPGSSSGATQFWARSVPLLRRHLGVAWQLWVALGLAGQWPLWQQGGRGIRAVVLYGAALAVIYPWSGAPFFPWYAVPVVVAMALGVGAFALGIGRALAESVLRLETPRLIQATAVSAALLVVTPLVASQAPATGRWWQQFDGYARYATFREAGYWIRQHSRPDERIAHSEIGTFAYYSHRPVDDLMGLVTEESLPYVASGDRVGAFLLRPPEFFPHYPGQLEGIVRSPWFADAYREVAVVRPPNGRGEAVTVYRLENRSLVPPPRPPRSPRPHPRSRR